jgi:hypothetical protein
MKIFPYASVEKGYKSFQEISKQSKPDTVLLYVLPPSHCTHKSLRTEISYIRFQVLTAASMKMTVFWVVAWCSLVEVYQCFSSTTLHGATTQETVIFIPYVISKGISQQNTTPACCYLSTSEASKNSDMLPCHFTSTSYTDNTLECSVAKLLYIYSFCFKKVKPTQVRGRWVVTCWLPVQMPIF